MLFHTMVGSNDIERSKRFYNALLGALGHGEATLNMAGSGHARLFYRKDGGTNFIVTQPINDEPASPANGSTVAFTCNSPEQVRQFHDVAVATGGTSIEEPPGPRDSAMGKIHLAYVRDPDGTSFAGSISLNEFSPKAQGNPMKHTKGHWDAGASRGNCCKGYRLTAAAIGAKRVLPKEASQ